jgi:hypothetical protein
MFFITFLLIKIVWLTCFIRQKNIPGWKGFQSEKYRSFRTVKKMNEQRKPSETWFKRLPRKVGQKASRKCNLKIELFPVYLWGRWWSPGSSLFSPRLPLRTEDRLEFWQTRYRIRVNGKWVGSRAKYVGYTKQQIRERYFKG